MKENRNLLFKTLKILSIIILYYIIGNKNIFPYILSLSLYRIFISCFTHISIKDNLKKLTTNNSKIKLFKIVLLAITLISVIFFLLSILISDLLSIYLDLNNILIIFIFEGISIITMPLIKLISEYLENTKNSVNYNKLPLIYNIIDNTLLLIIALFVFRVFKVKTNTGIALLYLSKILSAVIIIAVLYLINNKKNISNKTEDKISYSKEVKKILTTNSYRSTIEIVKNSYYYISIIILYIILKTRYNYNIQELSKIITFTYFYSLSLIEYLIYISKLIAKKIPNENLERLYTSFRMMLTISIILGVVSPLTCKVLFNNSDMFAYLTIINILSIFILLYDITYESIKNKTVIYISLLFGILLKMILIIPLINSFYRMGYNLVYGDIMSSSIAMLASIIINYIYLKNAIKSKIRYFDKILDILYENILLSIILILTQFIIPIDSSNYLKSLGIIIIYITISVVFITLKNKKRG